MTTSLSQGDTLQSTLLVSEVGNEGTLGLDVLDVRTVGDASLLSLEGKVLLLVDVGETPLLGDDLWNGRDMIISEMIVKNTKLPISDVRSSVDRGTCIAIA